MTERRVVRVVQGGPILVEGPVRIELPDGSAVESDRFMVAICTCRRSKTYPLCDTSHRKVKRSGQSSGKRPA
ncbi:CDGSH iron-sulfur domain-containing protein [Mycolicibacterium peregrinum]|uniref:CDGSH iron-sulfur domain-containing protein n=1 Tax=Mycolicibacterium peregrinum TaxID=43304 RepID=A0A4Z0HNR0_MYCPR|nr:CDGSH iron-sulfur domain-containing protein [Mycolicibacterium peregrinum]TGB39591.1 CDGSH iron-sulfur domain-containing protein [Mycolicibacterium peregrinum]TGB39964.1 CDGSH iron-sulfur domain-containing protein [Mycolicibacterium peregrinum]